MCEGQRRWLSEGAGGARRGARARGAECPRGGGCARAAPGVLGRSARGARPQPGRSAGKRRPVEREPADYKPGGGRVWLRRTRPLGLVALTRGGRWGWGGEMGGAGEPQEKALGDRAESSEAAGSAPHPAPPPFLSLAPAVHGPESPGVCPQHPRVPGPAREPFCSYFFSSELQEIPKRKKERKGVGEDRDGLPRVGEREGWESGPPL